MTLSWWTRDQDWWRWAADEWPPAISVRTAAAVAIMGLRRDVLRAGRLDLEAGLADDDDPTSCHLAAIAADGGALLGCVSLVARRAESLALQLSLMAVAPANQGQGIGAALIGCAQRLVSSAPEPYDAGIWANARDTALGFYERLGFVVVGDGFISSMDLPHHRVRWSPDDAEGPPR